MYRYLLSRKKEKEREFSKYLGRTVSIDIMVGTLFARMPVKCSEIMHVQIFTVEKERKKKESFPNTSAGQ